jgi:hypothetical protein
VRIRGKLTGLLIAIALGATVQLAGAAPAMAFGTRPASCGTASLCFYVNNNFSDGPGRLTQSSGNLANFAHSTCGGTWNNCISSIWNATPACWHLYDSANFVGGFHNLAPNDGYTNLGSQAAYDNKITSVKRNPNGTGSCNF